MTYEISSTVDREPFSFETEHLLDAEVMQILEDLFSANNVIHWTDGDVENFFALQGRVVSGGFNMAGGISAVNMPAFLTDGNADKIERMIVCVYGSKENLEGLDNIIKTIRGFLPEKTEIFAGHIVDKKLSQDSMEVKLTAIVNEAS